MKKAYSNWWVSIQPYLVNENVSLDKEKPFWVDYKKQKAKNGIPKWNLPDLQKNNLADSCLNKKEELINKLENWENQTHEPIWINEPY